MILSRIIKPRKNKENTEKKHYSRVSFKKNVFSFTGIDQTKVDLTQGNSTSTINFIGNNVLENLVIYNNRASAISAGVPLYSAYIKTNGNTYPSTATWVRDLVLPA